MSCFFSFNSNIHTKAMAAAWTAHGVRALNAGQAQIVFALGALFVNVRFAILPAVPSELEPFADTSEESQKRAVFLLSLIDISRKRPIGRPGKQAGLYDIDQAAPQKKIQKHEPKAGPHHHLIQLIRTVSSAPKSPKPIPKSHVPSPFLDRFLCSQRDTQIKHLAESVHLHLHRVPHSAGIQNLFELLHFGHRFAVDLQNQISRA